MDVWLFVIYVLDMKMEHHSTNLNLYLTNQTKCRDESLPTSSIFCFIWLRRLIFLSCWAELLRPIFCSHVKSLLLDLEPRFRVLCSSKCGIIAYFCCSKGWWVDYPEHQIMKIYNNPFQNLYLHTCAWQAWRRILNLQVGWPRWVGGVRERFVQKPLEEGVPIPLQGCHRVYTQLVVKSTGLENCQWDCMLWK